MNILERILGNNGQQDGGDGGMPVIERPPVETPVNNEKPVTPPMWSITLHNDNSTNPDFVIRVLQEAFGVEGDAAQQIMMKAHRGSQATVKVTTKDLAESQQAIANGIISTARGGYDFFVRDQNMGCQLTFSIAPESKGE